VGEYKDNDSALVLPLTGQIYSLPYTTGIKKNWRHPALRLYLQKSINDASTLIEWWCI
jgi:hypothetical protein